MSTAELKNKLIEKIHSTDDQQILKDVLRLLNINLTEIDTEAPFELTAEMNKAIDEAKIQIKYGEYFTHEEAKERMSKWLGE